MREVVAQMEAPGAVWGLVEGPRRRVTIDAAGPLRRDAIVRIASITKPIVAVLTVALVEDGVLDLDDPIERWLPAFADRRVLRDPQGPLDDTLPARRSTTVRDLLQMGVGWGFASHADDPDPIGAAIGRLGLGSGWLPPRISPDRWVERAATLPMAHQPGEGWRYQYSFDALAVLLERATRRRLDGLLRDRVLDPLDMAETGYTVPMVAIERVPANHFGNRAGRLVEAAPAGDPRLMVMPVFRSGATGLVSTVDDLVRFATMLLDRGDAPRGRVLAESTWRALVTSDLTPAAARDAETFIGAPCDWGLGLAVDREARYPGSHPGRFGWDGGTGTSLWVDPQADVAAVLLTRQGMGAPDSWAPVERFWEAVHAD